MAIQLTTPDEPNVWEVKTRQVGAFVHVVLVRLSDGVEVVPVSFSPIGAPSRLAVDPVVAADLPWALDVDNKVVFA